MRQVTATEKYRAVNEGKLAKGAFVRDMRMAHPSIISQWNSYDDTVQILKNKGFISEKSNVDSYDSRFELNISSDSIDRGVRYELQAKGIDPVNAKEEDFNGCKNTVIKNLKKDPLHYILLVSGESNKVDKNDKPKEVKRGAADKDTFNDLKKATLKEGYTEEQINAAIQRLKEKKNLANEASQEESVADYIIKHYTNPKTGKSLVDDEIVSDFFKTHPEWEQQADGTDDGMKDLLHNFGEYLEANYEGPSDMGEEEKRELPKSIADKERDQIEKDAMKAKGMIKEKLTEVEAIQVGIDKGYSNEQIAAAISKLKENQVTAEEKKTIDLYDDGDVVVDISRATPEQERLINYEFEISEFGDSEEAQEVADELMNLNSADDVENYYANVRGWDQDPDMRSSIRAAVDIFRGLDEKRIRVKKEGLDAKFAPSPNSDLPDTNAEEYDVATAFKKARVDMSKPVTVIHSYGHAQYASSNKDEMSAEAAIKKLEAERQDRSKQYTDDGMKVPEDHHGYEFENNSVLEEEMPEGHEYKFTYYQLGDADYAITQEKSGVSEKKGKDHDGDGDIDGDDYMAAKDKAIKKAMGKDEVVRESLKNIISKVLEEQTINEAATNHLAGLADTYGDFEGFKQSIIQLQDIVTDIESYYDKTRNKIQKVYDSIADIRNDEGLKVGAFLAPSIEAAFNKDLRPVSKAGFTKGLETPKVKVMKKDDLNAGSMYEEEPKQSVFAPVNENWTIKPGKKLKKLSKGGITYEIGEDDPNDDGRIESIEKYSNGYFISGVVYGDDDGEEYEREGYGYAIDLDGKKMDEEELKGRFEKL